MPTLVLRSHAYIRVYLAGVARARTNNPRSLAFIVLMLMLQFGLAAQVSKQAMSTDLNDHHHKKLKRLPSFLDYVI
jgi:hypothetical protein